MEADNQECTNCHKIFPVDRIDLHEAYCCRNIRNCKNCEKMIDIKDQEQHDVPYPLSQKEFHEKKECPLCTQMLMPELFKGHEEICPRKPIVCKYCENTWAQVEYAKHSEACGARTKPCLICHKNIMLKDFDEHSSRCERRREERAEVSQDQMRDRGNRRIERGAGERERQNSTNNMREPNKSNSMNKIIKPNSFKPSNIIGPEGIKPAIDPVPISIRLAMKNKEPQQRPPLKSKN